MDRRTPTPSYRPARPMPQQTRKQSSSRSHTAPRNTDSLIITTDYDREHARHHHHHHHHHATTAAAATSADTDLIFHMSPVHPATAPPPLPPMLYSFPRPSHGYATQAHPHDRQSSAPHAGAPRKPPPMHPGADADPSDESTPRQRRGTPQGRAPANAPPRRNTSAPIPIPRTQPRPTDPGAVLPPVRTSGGRPAAPPPRSSSTRRRSGVREDADGSASDDSSSPKTSSTAYSSAAGAPFRFSKFLDNSSRR